MARYNDAVCRICRRENLKMFLKGDRCYSDKCAFERRSYRPGQHGQGRGKRSEYGIQLREKQKVKRIYGLRERQFRRYYEMCSKKEGVTGNLMLERLEKRIDNTIYRLQLASSRKDARQLVDHRHVKINGKYISSPSQEVNVGDEIALRERTWARPSMKNRLKKIDARALPKWIDFDMKKGVAKILALPTADQVDHQPNMQLIIEFYSR